MGNRTLVLLFAVLVGCCATQQPRLSEAEMRAVRVRDAETSGYPPCGSRYIGRDDVCYDSEGITWSGCAWASCNGNQECVAKADAETLAVNCGSPGWRPCDAK